MFNKISLEVSKHYQVRVGFGLASDVCCLLSVASWRGFGPVGSGWNRRRAQCRPQRVLWYDIKYDHQHTTVLLSYCWRYTNLFKMPRIQFAEGFQSLRNATVVITGGKILVRQRKPPLNQ